MSRFSTKTDLYDVITIHKSFKEFRKRYPNIYLGHSDEPIKYKTLKDLVKYYPYIPWYSEASTRKREGIIRLSEVSYVDLLELDDTTPKELADSLRRELANEIERAKENGYDGTIEFNW